MPSSEENKEILPPNQIQLLDITPQDSGYLLTRLGNAVQRHKWPVGVAIAFVAVGSAFGIKSCGNDQARNQADFAETCQDTKGSGLSFQAIVQQVTDRNPTFSALLTNINPADLDNPDRSRDVVITKIETSFGGLVAVPSSQSKQKTVPSLLMEYEDGSATGVYTAFSPKESHIEILDQMRCDYVDSVYSSDGVKRNPRPLKEAKKERIFSEVARSINLKGAKVPDNSSITSHYTIIANSAGRVEYDQAGDGLSRPQALGILALILGVVVWRRLK